MNKETIDWSRNFARIGRSEIRLTPYPDSLTYRPMSFPSVMGLFGLGNLPRDKKRALTLVMATSVGLTMGVNFIQPVLPALIKPFGITDSALGLVMTALTGPAIFLAPLFGVVADLRGRRLLLGVGLILYGIFGGAMALAPTFTWLLVFRALQGVAYSAVTPLTIVLIGDLLEGDHEIGGQGLKVFLDRVGYMILPPLGGFLATIAWYWPFAFYFLMVPLGVVSLFWMPETKGQSSGGTQAYLGDILRLTRHPKLLIAFSAGFLRFFLDYGFLTYFPIVPGAHPRHFDGDGRAALHIFRRWRDDHIEPSRPHRRRPRQSLAFIYGFCCQRPVDYLCAVYP